MIQFKHITKKYSAGTFALNDISFSIQSGEFVFLIGPSGAGKTTIIKLILNDIAPDSGEISVNNEAISRMKLEKLRRNLGVVFQDFKIIQEKSAIENIIISLNILGIKNKEEEANKTLAMVGLSDKRHFFPVQLSAGELQRLAIARAVAGGRSIVLADEPTGNVDPVTSWEIVKLFRKIHDGKRTIIFATHSADIVNALNKRVITLKKGKLVRDVSRGKYNLDQT